ncbi:MAG: hypothetical protein JNK82_41650 [Myxococcaceae bacterium]|nr:hypothetical protein [Myxococcaceae bacterium]
MVARIAGPRFAAASLSNPVEEAGGDEPLFDPGSSTFEADVGREPALNLTGTTYVEQTQPQTEPGAAARPELAAFLAAHPEVVTGQDLVVYAGRHGPTLYELCAQLHIDPLAVETGRAGLVLSELVDAPRSRLQLPDTVEEAAQFAIAQVSKSKDCGPASLAMALAAAGQLPSGMEPQQQIDYARALMHSQPGATDLRIEQVTLDNGLTVPQLSASDEETWLSSVAGGARRTKTGGVQRLGVDALNASLASGEPVVLYGEIASRWVDNFPGGYNPEGLNHMVAVLGRQGQLYLVADPLANGEVVAMSLAQLQEFNPQLDFVSVATAA